MIVDLPNIPKGKRRKTRTFTMEFQGCVCAGLGRYLCRPAWSDAFFTLPGAAAIETTVDLFGQQRDYAMQIAPVRFHFRLGEDFIQRPASDVARDAPGVIDALMSGVPYARNELATLRQREAMRGIWTRGQMRSFWMPAASFLVHPNITKEIQKSQPFYHNMFSKVYVPLPTSAHERFSLPVKISESLSDGLAILESEVNLPGELTTRVRYDLSALEKT